MNYYDVLRINKDASKQEIKDSYKRLIKRYHPDLYPGNKKKAETITRDLNEAYEVLSDPEKRAMYDSSLQEPHSWEEKFKENIHTFVDKKTEKMSYESKKTMILIIILISLTILLITAIDFINFQNSIIENEKMKEQKLLEQQQLLEKQKEQEEKELLIQEFLEEYYKNHQNLQ